MRDIHEKSCRMASSFVQRAGITALLGSQECVQQMVTVYARRRDWIVKQLHGLPGIVCPAPHGTFYVFPKIAGLGITSDAFARQLLEDKHVLVFPGSYYGAAGKRISGSPSPQTTRASRPAWRPSGRRSFSRRIHDTAPISRDVGAVAGAPTTRRHPAAGIAIGM